MQSLLSVPACGKSINAPFILPDKKLTIRSPRSFSYNLFLPSILACRRIVREFESLAYMQRLQDLGDLIRQGHTEKIEQDRALLLARENALNRQINVIGGICIHLKRAVKEMRRDEGSLDIEQGNQ